MPVAATRSGGARPHVDGETSRPALQDGPSAGSGDRPHAFELVVLGSGGGPLETDCSGYLLKPLASSWKDGIIALEGGSGLGALTTILTHKAAADVFPGFDFPASHNSPVLKAAYMFSHLSCYVLTHAHLDHAVSLVLLSGSIPPKPPSLAPVPVHDDACPPPSPSVQQRIPVYATRETLESLAEMYNGRLWPELGKWAEERSGSRSAKRRRAADTSGVGVMFSPLVPSREHRPLHDTLPVTTLVFPVAHGHTSHGLYTSSAVFIRYDPSTLDSTFRPGRPAKDWQKLAPGGGGAAGREFLFFGDVESGWRRAGEEHVDPDNRREADARNRPIWVEAAKGHDRGLLAGIFIECSYDSSRPIDLMYGHLCPPSLYHELRTLASLVRDKPRPLAGLRVFVTHIKEQLAPHPSGQSARARIKAELDALEAAPNGALGVEFVIVNPGDRILI
ncbi:3',5'-cyclic-nucleotide phosphodiesterase pde1 [Cryptotrichosporon argae]